MTRKSCLSAGLATVLILLCLGAFTAGATFLWLPAQAENAFGPPNESIDPIQRAILSGRLLLQADQLKEPYNPLGAPVEFSIALGESTRDITERLESEGLIADAEAVRDYLVYAGLDTSLQAGEYTLSARMTPIEIAHNLQDATPEEITFRILPGWRMEEIAEALPTSGLTITPQGFLTSARSSAWHIHVGAQVPPNDTLEGYLYPDSYRLPRYASTEDLIATLLENFRIKMTHELLQGFQNQGLSPHEAVILASIVQREAVVEDEMPLIASVFHNRLAAGIRLETDPTVQYALGYNAEQGTWWTNPLTLVDLEVNSPYNTYRHAGLPPGPIANPGLNALQAVAFPAQTPYYYFRAACDGSGRHSFAETFEEHKNNACP